MTSSAIPIHNRKLGFTLIELLVVIAIVAILAALAPMLTSGAILDRQLNNAAVQLQQDLVLVQNKAITYGSGGPLVSAAATRFVMRLYLNSDAFAYQSTLDGTWPSGSSPTPGTGIVVRQMTSVFGFPAYFGLSSPASVTIRSSRTITGDYVDVVFDNQGLAYWRVKGDVLWTSGSGSIMITNSSASKRIQVTVSVIGRVSVAWVPGYK